jgi:hypothetical protein
MKTFAKYKHLNTPMKSDEARREFFAELEEIYDIKVSEEELSAEPDPSQRVMAKDSMNSLYG